MKAKRIMGMLLALMLCAGALLGAGAAEGLPFGIPEGATAEEALSAIRRATGVRLAPDDYLNGLYSAYGEFSEGEPLPAPLIGEGGEIATHLGFPIYGIVYLDGTAKDVIDEAAGFEAGCRAFAEAFAGRRAIPMAEIDAHFESSGGSPLIMIDYLINRVSSDISVQMASAREYGPAEWAKIRDSDYEIDWREERLYEIVSEIGKAFREGAVTHTAVFDPASQTLSLYRDEGIQSEAIRHISRAAAGLEGMDVLIEFVWANASLLIGCEIIEDAEGGAAFVAHMRINYDGISAAENPLYVGAPSVSESGPFEQKKGW